MIEEQPDWAKLGRDAVERLKHAATPERLASIVNSKKRSEELIADLIALWKGALAAAQKDDSFEQVQHALVVAVTWVNYLHEKGKRCQPQITKN